MRTTCCLAILMLVGCGSKSDSPAPAAGIPLSIKSPKASSDSEKSAIEKELQRNEPLTNPAVEALVAKARQSVVSGRPNTAIESLSQAIGLSSSESRLFRLRGDVYVLMGQFANAQADFTLAVNLDPNNAEIRNVRGYFLMTRGLTDEAGKDLEKATSLDPSLAPAWNNRGLVELSREKFEAAEEFFTKAVNANRKYTDALNNRGFARFKLKKFESALTDLRAAIKQDRKYTSAWNNVGLVYMEAGRFEDALKAFSETIRLAPMDSRWLAHRRAAYLKLERYEEASNDAQKIRWLAGLSNLTRLAMGDSGSPTGWIRRADYLAKGSEFGAAVQDYTRALALAPGNLPALNGRAVAWLNIGEAQKAIADCDESLVASPSTDAFSVRGDAWMALGNYRQAVSDFESARRFDHSVADAYTKLAAQLRSEGNTEDAASAEKQAKEVSDRLEGRLEPEASKPLPFPEITR